MFNHKAFKFMALGMLLLLSIGLLSACSGGGDNNSINADLSTYKIDLSKTTAAPGEITFHVKNTASDMAHEFVIFKTDLDAANLPTDDAGNVVEDQLESVDEIELNPNESGDLTVDLDAGHYAIVCNQPGHYAQGMYINFVVQ